MKHNPIWPKILWELDVFGPFTPDHLAQRTGLNARSVYGSLSALTARGRDCVRPVNSRWGRKELFTITPKGTRLIRDYHACL